MKIREAAGIKPGQEKQDIRSAGAVRHAGPERVMPRLTRARRPARPFGGFGWLFNWNLLADGEQTVGAGAAGAECGRATGRATPLGGCCAAWRAHVRWRPFPCQAGATGTREGQQHPQHCVLPAGE